MYDLDTRAASMPQGGVSQHSSRQIGSTAFFLRQLPYSMSQAAGTLQQQVSALLTLPGEAEVHAYYKQVRSLKDS